MAISLASLQTGKKNVPLRMIVVGSPGVGKTTFACSAPSPVVLPTEEGLDELIDAGLLPADLPRFPLLTTYQQVVDALAALYQEEHPFKTVVMDSLDWCEPLVWAHTCEQNKWQSIEAPGYGKGYVEADRYWWQLLEGFNALRRDRGMSVILTAHTDVKKFESPDGPAYDRYQIKIHKRAHAMFEEWAAVVGTAHFKTLISTESKGSGKSMQKTHKAVGVMDRVLYTSERPSAVAKNRYGLPAEMPFTWDAFSAAMSAANPTT